MDPSQGLRGFLIRVGRAIGLILYIYADQASYIPPFCLVSFISGNSWHGIIYFERGKWILALLWTLVLIGRFLEKDNIFVVKEIFSGVSR